MASNFWQLEYRWLY